MTGSGERAAVAAVVDADVEGRVGVEPVGCPPVSQIGAVFSACRALEGRVVARRPAHDQPLAHHLLRHQGDAPVVGAVLIVAVPPAVQIRVDRGDGVER